MKTIVKALSTATLAVFLFGCKDRTIQEITYTANVPVYMSEADFFSSIGSEAAKTLTNPGKIHINGSRLYIVDLFQGIHVFDNADPASPKNVAYIAVPGVVDISSKGNILYVDGYKDLITLDASNLEAVEVLDVDKNVFTQILPPTDNNYPLAPIDTSEGIVVDWEVETITERHDVDNWNPWRGWGRPQAFTSMDMAMAESNGGVSMTPILANGQSGSMARFSLVGDYLYTVDGSNIEVYHLGDAADPVPGEIIFSSRNIETLFPLDDKLYVGTTSGMLIYDLSNPAKPAYLSAFNHATQCDPVVVQNDLAYVTLRSGNNCGGWSNQLDVLDVSDINQPTLIRTYPMSNPHGLGIDQEALFICDGEAGLKVYNAADPRKIDENLIATFPEIQAMDVIPLGSHLLMIGEDGLYQYDYSDLQNIYLISSIQVSK